MFGTSVQFISASTLMNQARVPWGLPLLRHTCRTARPSWPSESPWPRTSRERVKKVRLVGVALMLIHIGGTRGWNLALLAVPEPSATYPTVWLSCCDRCMPRRV
jgi:hypothetical protein